MCTEPEALVAHAEVLVVANSGPETDRVMQLAGPDQIVIDLTRSAGKRPANSNMEVTKWQASALSKHLLPSSSPQSQSLHS